MKKIISLACMILILFFVVFQSVIADDSEYVTNEDPYETFNRPMFVFNDWLDKLILKPASTIYTRITPKPLSKGLGNIFNNIDTVPTIINDLLQANFYQAINDTWRLVINSTIGIAGFFDVASQIGLEPNNKQDLGLTLARWGWVDSGYLVLPFLGPGTVRDQLTVYPNYFLSIYPQVNSRNVEYGLLAASIIVKRAEILRYQNVLEQAAFDRYTFVKNAYLQRRSYLIGRNKELDNPYFLSDDLLPS
ncbi:VacJ family lipoprotein [Gammaproteobacteria bacterium]|nr:VacJ family lipoprotein [Gammaproteobacteria bacterium]